MLPIALQGAQGDFKAAGAQLKSSLNFLGVAFHLERGTCVGLPRSQTVYSAAGNVTKILIQVSQDSGKPQKI
jgi:hypothetical protein